MKNLETINHISNHYCSLKLASLEASIWFVKHNSFKNSDKWFRKYRRYDVISDSLDYYALLSYMSNAKACQYKNLSYKVIKNKLPW